MTGLAVRLEDGVFCLSGEFDMAGVETFTRQMAALLGDQGEVVLDLAGVTFMDSTAIGAILALAQRVGGRGFILRYPQAEVARVFDIVRLGEVPGIYIERRTG